MNTKSVVCLAALAGFLCAANPAYAEKRGFFEIFFPWLFKQDTGPDPSETLQAPFSYEKAVPTIGVENTNRTTSLDQAHRATREISEWVMMAVAESLTFEKPDFEENFRKTKDYFNKQAHLEYARFLQESEILDVLKSKKYYLHSFVENVPLLVNEGPVEGRYRWLFEVPIMTSYMDRGISDYEKAEPVNLVTVVTVQVGRSPDATGEHGVIIERWNGRVKKDSKQKMDKK